MKINLYQRVNMRISLIASGAEYRMDQHFQNLPMFGILILFQIERSSEIL